MGLTNNLKNTRMKEKIVKRKNNFSESEAAMELKTEKVENMCGGEGHVIIKHILGEKELNGKCGLYAQVTIEPGCSLGYHEHHNESETYYILSGQGDYDDNGTVRPVKTGMLHSHRIIMDMD